MIVNTVYDQNLKKINRDGKTHPKCEWPHSMGWDSRLNEKEEKGAEH